MYDIAISSRQIAVQWKAWLTHTRNRPPTLSELHTDMERQLQLAQRVGLLEAREQQERSRISEKQQATKLFIPGTSQVSHVDTVNESGGQEKINREPVPQLGSTHRAPQNRDHESSSANRRENPWASAPNADSYQPTPWSPKSIRRGS